MSTAAATTESVRFIRLIQSRSVQAAIHRTDMRDSSALFCFAAVKADVALQHDTTADGHGERLPFVSQPAKIAVFNFFPGIKQPRINREVGFSW